MDINVDLLQWFTIDFDKKSTSVLLNTSNGTIKNETISNQQLAEKLDKAVIRKKVYSSFKYNILDADPGNMQLTSKYNNGIRFLSISSVNMFELFLWKKIKVLKLLTFFLKSLRWI